MNKVLDLIVKHKGKVIIFFFALAIISGVISTKTSVNYNMVDYLPKDAQSTVAISIMNEEFNVDTPNARVMLKSVSVEEALNYKNKIALVEGVLSINWLDDMIGKDVLLNTPLSYIEADILKGYYKDNNALLNVSIENGEEIRVVDEIRLIIGEDNALAGDAVNAAETQSMAMSEVLKSMAILIPIILLILIISTTSWLEPLLFLATIGVAVVINMGLSALFGEVSFVTQTVSPILQLAVSLDYAIFLMHSFQVYKKKNEPDLAMKLAIKKSLPAVLASALTTVIGFSALIFMRFGIGSDLGLHLAKGVLLSFLSVMIFLPALTLVTHKLIEKTTHKNFMPSFKKISKGLMKIKIPFLILALIIVIPSFIAQLNTSFMYGMSGIAGDSRAGVDAIKIEKVFGKENILALLVPRENLETEVKLSEDLSKIPNVINVVSFVKTVGIETPIEFVPKEITEQFYSNKYARIIIYMNVPEEGEKTFETVKLVLDTSAKHYDEYYLTGQSITLFDMKNIVEVDTRIVNLIAIIGIFIVILLAFKSVFIPIFLVFSIETAIWINLSFAFFTGSSLSFIGYLIISTVQLGATVDYAILLTSHYLTERKELPKNDAMLKTLTKNLPAILVSASILATSGFILAAASTNPIIEELGVLLGRGTILSFVMVVLVLPALLLIFDKVVRKDK